MLVSNAEKGDMMRDIREGFEDCYRTDFGKPLAYGQRTKRKAHYSVTGEEAKAYKQQTIHFEAGGVPDLPELNNNDKDQPQNGRGTMTQTYYRKLSKKDHQ